MTDQLLPYYNRELAFIRRLGAEFAEAHPTIAGRLQLGADTVEDPHVERIIESHGPGEIGGGIGTILTAKGHDLRLEARLPAVVLGEVTHRPTPGAFVRADALAIS